MKIGIIQMPVADDKAENLACAGRYVRECAKQGAELAILPEMFVCPYSNAHFPLYAEEQGGFCYAALSEIAAENGLWLIGGSMPEFDRGRLYNTSYVFDPKGGFAAKHRKVHLFDIDVKGGQSFKESAVFAAGTDVTVFDMNGVKVGLCICFDMRFPELSGLMALSGAKLIAAPAAFNMTTGPAHWELMFRQRAVDCQLYTIGAAPARDTGGQYVSYGNSIAVSPWGEVLYRAGDKASCSVIDIDLAKVSEVRAQLPLLSARRTDIYDLVMK